MTGSIHIPGYTKKDLPILLASMLPVTVLLNYFLFGTNYFNNWLFFIPATLVLFTYLGTAFTTYSLVAISLRNRFPDDRDVFIRLGFSISIFFLMSAVYISILLFAYEYFHLFGYEYNEQHFTSAYATLIVVNIFLTFLNEGVYRFEKYKATITETVKLKKEYIHSQLIGLKSQMNPHFLFNSLNTLSCLIHEDAEKAEDFLDHMSKVFRYMLRQNDEELVTVETELNFIRSYYYLLKARHEDALQLSVNVDEESRQMLIPPLTLQMIGEIILTRNALSRSKPLSISVYSLNGRLEIKNNMQARFSQTEDCCDVIENINNKFCLLCQQSLRIIENGEEHIIQIPLIQNKEHLVPNKEKNVA